MKKLPKKIIDFHVHLFPEKGFDAIWNAFEVIYNHPVLHKLYHNECIEYLRQHDVGPIVYSNYAHKKGFAQKMNEWNRALLDNTQNIYCFAAFHPEDENAMDYVEDILSHPKVIGIKLHFLIQEFYPYDERFFPLYEMVIQKNKRLLMHIGNGPIGNQYTGFNSFKKLLEYYPDLPVNIPHMGGYEYGEFMNLLDIHPELYLDTSYSFWPQVTEGYNLGAEQLEKYQDRILYGSDFPNVILPREDEITGLLQYELSDEFYNKIFYENAKKMINKSCAEKL